MLVLRNDSVRLLRCDEKKTFPQYVEEKREKKEQFELVPDRETEGFISCSGV